MYINNLKLRNFRNYEILDLDFNKQLNIIIGNNAQGKTNILESLYVLALTKSNLCSNDQFLIRDNYDFANIIGDVVGLGGKKKLEITITKRKKKLKIDGMEISKIINYIKNLNVIFFGPSDLKLIKDIPSFRRKFLNTEISQLSIDYLKLMNQYNVLLKQKNEYLKLLKKGYKRNDTYLLVLNNKLVDLSYLIFVKRKEFILLINNKIADIYGSITGFNDLKINYFSQLNEVSLDLFKDKVNKGVEKEILYGSSLYGIHRDDLIFMLGDKDLAKYGSQGQIKSAVLALKMAELDIFYEVNSEYPVLLLDDIFSELDIKARNKLVSFINNQIQTIITTTDIKQINKKYVSNANVYHINNGKVVKRQYGRD